jgi:Zn-dependent peptidase ImmA (M78 family)
MREPPAVRHGRIAAEAFRYEHGLGDAPIRDLFGFLERAFPDVFVIRRPMPGGPEGALIRHDRGWLIIINTYNNALVRQRFTAAHELGHLQFDADSDVVHVDTELFAANLIEVRANAFAVHLLLPADVLRSKYADRSFNVANATHVVGLAMEYGLSLESLSWHLKNVCNISDQQRASIVKGIDAYHVAMQMGLADRVLKERHARGAYGWPQRYLSLVARALDRGVITEDEVRDYIEDDDIVAQILDAS